ncbi:MAG: response regulator [Epsilonproteobacteria bacterium]|nr:response regulator [Campylobacterota bacterium]
MKFFMLFTIILFFTTVEASYLRSIRLESFNTKDTALLAQKKLIEYANKNETISNLQKELNFEYKVIKVGKYYMTSIEPINDKDAVQTILKTIHNRFPTSYPRKLKSTPSKVIKKEIQEQEIIKKTAPVQIKKVIPIPEKQKENIQIIKTQPLQKYKTQEQKVQIDTPISPLVKNNIPAKTYDTWYYALLGVLVLMLLIAIRFLFKLKREKETYVDKNLINIEKIAYLKLELENKDKVLSNATHELRTPMTAIMGLTHIILESDLAKQQKEYIQKIENSSENMLKIINDILDLSKIQAGKLKIEKAEFNINDILEYVLNTISIKAKNNHISILMNIGNDVPSLLVGDSFRLGQVLINLLSNSVKFTKDGEVSLKVEKLSSHGDHIKLKFIVSDTGIGMTEKQLQNLFQSFHQAEDSTTREYGGTGLGLSISKQLIEMMDGDIKVTSQKDVGTTFVFSINFNLKDSQNKRQYRLPSASLLNKRILIVDESSKNVISLIRSLGYFNYKTHSIPSFEKAILEHTIKFDIIIINQANLTTLAIKKIKEIQKKDNSKIVILSELYSIISTKSLEGLQIGAYLKSPFTQQNILNMITELYVTKNLDNRSRKKKFKDKLKELSNKKILVAEDNEVNHKVIAGLLAHTSIELTFVENGRDAIMLLNDNIKFDMILMDINMPILGGYDATREIRKNSNFDNIPIFAFSADVTDEAVNKALASGMQGHISKPIIVDIFYKKIFDTLNIPISYSNHKSIAPIPQKQKNNFKELSISAGLERCNNDKEFYELILKDFKKMYIKSPQNLERLCKEANFKEARHMAMDIKDIALNIGAYNLCESAATMEYEFEKASRSKWVELINLYAKNLQKLFIDIDKYINKV